MPRYIDADALIKKVFPYDVVDKKSYAINAKTIYEEIQNAPTVNVAEVKHGEWKVKEFKSTNKKFITCSVCNLVIDCIYHNIYENEFDYCPYCGAKMGGERKDK